VSCQCIDRLDLGLERYLVRGETIHTSVGCFHASLFLRGEGERFIIENAQSAPMVVCPDCQIPVAVGAYPQHFHHHRLPPTSDLESLRAHVRSLEAEIVRAKRTPTFGELAELKALLDPLRVSSTETLDNIVRRVLRELTNVTTERDDALEKRVAYGRELEELQVQRDRADVEIAAWKKGVEDANRISQEHAARSEAAYAAVRFLLDRIQSDADTGYQLGWGCETFRQLCLAEAAHTGKPFEEIETERRKTFWRHEPRVLELRRELEASRA
jgi:hypothetical protein